MSSKRHLVPISNAPFGGIRIKRIAVRTILEFLSAGESIEKILAQYLTLNT